MEAYDKSQELPEPWYWTEEDWTGQLKKEISADHILSARTVKTLARRQDQDDFLFLVDDDKFAVVHLTLSSQRHIDGRWPRTKLFHSWDDVLTNRILVDKEEWDLTNNL